MTTITIDRVVLQELFEAMDLYYASTIAGKALCTTIRAALLAPATAPSKLDPTGSELHSKQADQAELPSQGQVSAPAWQDAPTVPGIWLSDRGYENPYRWGIYKVVDPDHEKGMTLEDERWFGPIQPDSGDKP